MSLPHDFPHSPTTEKIEKIVSITGDTLVLDFSSVDFLDTFDIMELFSYIVSLPFEGDEYVIRDEDKDVVAYLYRINFFMSLEDVKNLSPHHRINPYGGMSNRLLEMRVYRYKQDFYGDFSKIYSMIAHFGLSEEKTSLIASSLGEVVDNAFSHNLGRWDPDIGPLGILLAQHFPNKKQLCFSFCDFGVGFLSTLGENYPDIPDEATAVTMALRVGVTGRPQQKGGNGLVYLQKNVFNGFRGELKIRSRNTLIELKKDQPQAIFTTPHTVGSSVLFTLYYS